MVKKIMRIFFSSRGLLLGYGITDGINKLQIFDFFKDPKISGFVYLGVSLLFGIIFYFITPKLTKGLKKLINFIEGELQKIPTSDIAIGSVGLIVGLIMAYLLSQPFYKFETVGVVISIFLYIIIGYVGLLISLKKKDEILSAINNLPKKQMRETTGKTRKGSTPKILDTSVIIDGRIADICNTGFVEGPLVIPEFVLEELQHIADSSDDLKRSKGRRGLDILNRIQKELDIEVIIHDKKFAEEKEVDSKLLKLTKMLDGKILTNDYNLNKVAEVQSIEVLNINDLANAVKPILLPGEEMYVQIIKEGKEAGQGLAYLDDGTMIVVESGKKHTGNSINVVVTSVLQTSAGRMIFAKPNM